MSEIEQLDLVDWIAAQTVAKSDPQPDTMICQPDIPSRSYWWDNMLKGSEAAKNVRIHVSERWTGVVVEQINDPVLGRLLLWAKGNVAEYPFSANCPASRTIFMTAEQVEKSGLPVKELDRGEGYVRYTVETQS